MGLETGQLNQNFLTLLEHTSDFIYFKDRDSRICFCSQVMANLCGYRDWREMIGKHDRELFPEETARIYQEEELPLFQEGKPLLDKVDPYIAKNGERRWVSTNKWPVFADDGKTVVGIFGISRDITERKRAEEELSRQARKSEILLRLGSDGIHILDAKGNVLDANEHFCNMLGYTREEALKLNVTQWDVRWSAEELRQEIIPGVLEHRGVFETRHRRRDGQIIDVEVSAVGVELGAEERVLFAAARDITERKRAEQDQRTLAAELAETQRMKDIFTDILRHDLLNPVSAIKLVADVLLKSESDARKVDLLRSVQRSVAALIEMTESAARLASVTGSLALEFPEADPVSVLRSVLPDLKLKAAEKNITITDRSASSGFTARFNPLMKEVLANLLSNAIKYSPSGTEIELVVEDRGESWGLAVRDQGFGVPDEHKEKIFNRFERLEKQGVKGSGLGLAIAKQVVVLHGGEIWVEDNPPGGSLFLVKLPKAPKAARFAGPDQAVGGSALTETVD